MYLFLSLICSNFLSSRRTFLDCPSSITLQASILANSTGSNHYIYAMETSTQPLSIESFSYSWLVNLKPSLDESLRASLDASDEAPFIEMDPSLPPSKRFLLRGSQQQDFNFDFPASQSPLTLVHADELISNGFLMPLFLKRPTKVEAYDVDDPELDSVPTKPVSSQDQKNVNSATSLRCSSLRRYRKLSKRIIEKYLDFVRPLCRKIQLRRSASTAENRQTRLRGVDRFLYSPSVMSPRPSVACSADNWRSSCDSESSIYEAVLHCKRTIGK